jgi:hypothetical protein
MMPLNRIHFNDQSFVQCNDGFMIDVGETHNLDCA